MDVTALNRDAEIVGSRQFRTIRFAQNWHINFPSPFDQCPVSDKSERELLNKYDNQFHASRTLGSASLQIPEQWRTFIPTPAAAPRVRPAVNISSMPSPPGPRGTNIFATGNVFYAIKAAFQRGRL